MKFFVISLIVILQIGCASKNSNSGRYHHTHDSYPIHKEIPSEIHKIQDAKPKYEAKSKRGNPSSYTVFNKKYKVLDSSNGFKEKGTASFYGKKFHGYHTSNGEVYDMYKMTAAHKNLPLPTYLRVKNLENGKQVIVKVNDRGPFSKNRILDLSYAAAAKLGFLKKGTASVEITAIDIKQHYAKEKQKMEDVDDMHLPAIARNEQENKQEQAVAGKSYLQFGAFSQKENAQLLHTKVSTLEIENQIRILEDPDSKLFKVQMGPLTEQEISMIKTRLTEAKLPNPVLVKIDF